jgi:AcrR family transcriptional regulator
MVSTNAAVRSRGAATQNRILENAVHIASVEGLSSMSLATLAKATAMSKSGLFAHFRSKEALQIAVIDEAERIFRDAVVRPALAVPPGIARVSALFNRYVDYCVSGPFGGGCFFAAAAHEFDGRPGLVRDRLIRFFDTWHTDLREAVHAVVQQPGGDVIVFRDDSVADWIVFEVTALGLACNFLSQLHGDPARASKHGVEAVRELLDRLQASPPVREAGTAATMTLAMPACVAGT